MIRDALLIAAALVALPFVVLLVVLTGEDGP